MKKGQAWVARQVRKLPKGGGGGAAPSTLPLDPPLLKLILVIYRPCCRAFSLFETVTGSLPRIVNTSSVNSSNVKPQ